MERHFHPLAKSICSNETEEDFAFAFAFNYLKKKKYNFFEFFGQRF